MSPDEALFCAPMMVANGAFVVVPELLSLPVGEIYQVAANPDVAASIRTAGKILKRLLSILASYMRVRVKPTGGNYHKRGGRRNCYSLSNIESPGRKLKCWRGIEIIS
jgi:hypothetical protein